MPTYTYLCAACGERQSHLLQMSAHSPTQPCDCGAVANQEFNWQGESFVKGSERPFKLDATCVPLGWEHGNTDCEKQERRYAKMIGERRKNAQANDKKAIKGGIRAIGSVPRELVRMRQNQYGKSYFDPTQQTTSELKEKLQAEGLAFHKN